MTSPAATARGRLLPGPALALVTGLGSRALLLADRANGIAILAADGAGDVAVAAARALLRGSGKGIASALLGVDWILPCLRVREVGRLELRGALGRAPAPGP